VTELQVDQGFPLPQFGRIGTDAADGG